MLHQGDFVKGPRQPKLGGTTDQSVRPMLGRTLCFSEKSNVFWRRLAERRTVNTDKRSLGQEESGREETGMQEQFVRQVSDRSLQADQVLRDQLGRADQAEGIGLYVP